MPAPVAAGARSGRTAAAASYATNFERDAGCFTAANPDSDSDSHPGIAREPDTDPDTSAARRHNDTNPSRIANKYFGGVAPAGVGSGYGGDQGGIAGQWQSSF